MPDSSTQTEAKHTPGFVARLDAAVLALNPLTGQGEDYIWRPADRARTALIEARDFIASTAELLAALKALEPYLDAIVCYASTMDEREPRKSPLSVQNR